MDLGQNCGILGNHSPYSPMAGGVHHIGSLHHYSFGHLNSGHPTSSTGSGS